MKSATKNTDSEKLFKTGLSKVFKIFIGIFLIFLIGDGLCIAYSEWNKPEILLEPNGELLCILLGVFLLGTICFLVILLSYSITLTNEKIIIRKLWFKKSIAYKELIPYVKKYPPILINSGLYCMKKKRPLRILVGYLDSGYNFTRCLYEKLGLSFWHSEEYFISRAILGKKASYTEKSQRKAMYKAAKKYSKNTK